MSDLCRRAALRYNHKPTQLPSWSVLLPPARRLHSSGAALWRDPTLPRRRGWKWLSASWQLYHPDRQVQPQKYLKIICLNQQFVLWHFAYFHSCGLKPQTTAPHSSSSPDSIDGRRHSSCFDHNSKETHFLSHSPQFGIFAILWVLI